MYCLHCVTRLCFCTHVETLKDPKPPSRLLVSVMTHSVHVTVYTCLLMVPNVYVSPAGASLVQWNRLNENVIASAHDSDIRIWDMRVMKIIVHESNLSSCLHLTPSSLSFRRYRSSTPPPFTSETHHSFRLHFCSHVSHP